MHHCDNLRITSIFTERHDQCGKQHSRELLMMGTVMLETCWAFNKYNKISSGIQLAFFIFQDLIQLIRDHSAPSFLCPVTLTRNHRTLFVCFVTIRIGEGMSFTAIYQFLTSKNLQFMWSFLWTKRWRESCSASSVFSPVTAITPPLHTHFVHPPSTRYNLSSTESIVK